MPETASPSISSRNSGISSNASAAAFRSIVLTEPPTTASVAWVTVPSRVRTSPETRVPAPRSAVPFTTTSEPAVAPERMAVPSTTTIESTEPAMSA